MCDPCCDAENQFNLYMLNEGFEEDFMFMPSQTQYCIPALGAFKIIMKLLSVIKRWLQVSHL